MHELSKSALLRIPRPRAVLALLSGLGVLLVLSIWAVGYWRPIISGHTYDLMPGPGCINITLYWDPGLYNNEGSRGWHWRDFQGTSLKGHLQDLFAFGLRKEGFFTAYLVPLGYPLILFALLFMFSALPLYRDRKRRRLGLCLKCGYDLRASGERCPECGTATKRNSTTQTQRRAR